MINDASKLLGTWKAISFAAVDAQTGKQSRAFGDNPKGYLIFQPTRMFAFISFETRHSAPSPGEGSAPRPSMMAYSGPYEVTEGAFTTIVDMSAFEGWIGTKQLRYFKLDGDRLEITTPTTTRRDGGEGHSLLIWQREA